MPSPERSLSFVLDASVLIDYAKADVSILALAARHLGTVVIPAPVLQEVDQLNSEECGRLDLRVEQPTTDQLLEAGSTTGRLSFQDWLCLMVARDQKGICITNEKPLRTACTRAGVSVLWGLELMLELLQARQLSAEDAVEIAQAIHRSNPFITAERLREGWRLRPLGPRADA